MMDYYGIKTEAEILSGNIMRMGKSFTKRRDAEAITMAVKSLRKEARAWFNEKGSDLDSEAEDVYAKASAWYHVTYHYSYWGTYNEGMDRDHFLSFPWCVYDKLVHIKKEKARMALSSLEHQFSRGLPSSAITSSIIAFTAFEPALCILAISLNLLSSGKTSLQRSGRSFRLSSAHLSASFAKHKVSSTGQSRTAGSSNSKVPAVEVMWYCVAFSATAVYIFGYAPLAEIVISREQHLDVKP
ncbi:rna-dependent rna polymerase 1 [Quercus suber]|uniref:Rna-dependent rna polymerase 1 n=1 Tax=Quercus suber TaxID=58331 RepID=A0AAW0II72_QUESU